MCLGTMIEVSEIGADPNESILVILYQVETNFYVLTTPIKLFNSTYLKPSVPGVVEFNNKAKAKKYYDRQVECIALDDPDALDENL